MKLTESQYQKLVRIVAESIIRQQRDKESAKRDRQDD